MNVYEEAHNLSRAIKESAEFKEFKELRQKIDENEELAKMIHDFEAKRMEHDTKVMMGEELPEELTKQVQELFTIVSKDPTAAEYMQAEMRFSIMMNDVYKILGEAMGVGNQE